MGFFSSNCNPQNTKNKPGPDDRQPAVAGQFYSSDSTELRKTVTDFFAKAVAREKRDDLLAVIVPHAGYVFSGQVAASGINQIDPDKKYKRIFIIGSSHTTHFDAASVYAKGNFITPLGEVPVDTTVTNELLALGDVFEFYKDAHWYEHSLEVELPFLQVHMKNEFSIVPIVLGTSSPKTCKKIAEGLAPYLNSDNLFIISSDFSHYPAYKDAIIVDKLTSDAILKNSTTSLIDIINANAAKKIGGLVTSLCGWTSVLTLLYITESDTSFHFSHVQYLNSGDTPYGDSSKVVGYNAIALYKKPSTAEGELTLTDKDKKNLLQVARNTIISYFKDGKNPVFDTSSFSNAIMQHCGAFVTLHEDGNLRGCIGRFTSDIPLYMVICDMAIASSTQDYRFSKVTKDEIDKLEIEISVLSPMKKISSTDEIVLGKHGIYIMKGGKGGTFLPQVATETGWTLDEFLGHCSQDKAGIGWDGWKTADIYIYTATVFSEKD
jgi:MEMO1 family protein